IVNWRCRGHLFVEWILGIGDAKAAPNVCSLLVERKYPISVYGCHSQQPLLEPLCLRLIAPMANRAAASAHKPPLTGQLSLALREAGKLGLTSPGSEARPMIGDRRRRDDRRQLGVRHRRLPPERHVAFRLPDIPAKNGYGQCNDHPCSRMNPAALHGGRLSRCPLLGFGVQRSVPGACWHWFTDITVVFEAVHESHLLVLSRNAPLERANMKRQSTSNYRE